VSQLSWVRLLFTVESEMGRVMCMNQSTRGVDVAFDGRVLRLVRDWQSYDLQFMRVDSGLFHLWITWKRR
jgi:hypothetical protein